MSEEPHHDADATGLGTALADLASAIVDDPSRPVSVQARVRRQRVQRRVRRTVAVAGVAVATVAALVVLTRPTHEPAVTSVAADPTGSLPDCRVALAEPPPPARQGIKGLGTVVAATDQSVTIHLDAPSEGQPSELTAAITAATEWSAAATPTGRPPLAPGTHVGFAAEETDGTYQLLVLEIAPLNGADPAGADTAKAAKAAAKDTAVSDLIKAPATITALAPGSLSLHITDGSLAGQDVTATTGPGTTYLANGRKCTGADLAAGDTVRVVLAPSPTGDYAAEAVSLDG